MTPVEQQLAALRSRAPTAELASAPGAIGVVVIQDVKLPPGWNQPTTTVKFVVPAGYPLAALDCFWTAANLRLASGAMPQASQVQSPPVLPGGEPHLWFSWHVQSWNPGRDTLLTYFRVVLGRFKEVR